MAKVVKTTEIPGFAKHLYIKLYCDKVGNSSKELKKQAAQSWISLSCSKKKHFYKTCLLKNKINKAKRLEHAEPFLKSISSTNIDESNQNRSNDITEENELRLNESVFIQSNETNFNSQQTERTTSKIYEDFQEVPLAEVSGTRDDTELCNSGNNSEVTSLTAPHNKEQSESDNSNAAILEEQVFIQHEPTPPVVKCAKDLFNILNKDESKTYAELCPSERVKYATIVRRIKNQYIKKYEEYLESLTQKELFEYYKNNN